MAAFRLLCSTVLLLTLVPAVIARLHPSTTTAELTSILISCNEPKPDHANEALRAEAAEMKAPNAQAIDFTSPQEASVVFSLRNEEAAKTRRSLVGSSPPTCRSRCGLCQPCKPVHIPIGSPHGVISETEYYPEVWRCQCGNRLYMP